MEPFDPPNFVNNIINLGLEEGGVAESEFLGGLEEGGVAESEFLGGEFQVHSRAIPLQISKPTAPKKSLYLWPHWQNS